MNFGARPPEGQVLMDRSVCVLREPWSLLRIAVLSFVKWRQSHPSHGAKSKKKGYKCGSEQWQEFSNFQTSLLVRVRPLETGKETPLSPCLFLLPEALCPVLFIHFGKNLGKSAVLEHSHRVLPTPTCTLLGLYSFLYPNISKAFTLASCSSLSPNPFPRCREEPSHSFKKRSPVVMALLCCAHSRKDRTVAL